MLKTIFEQKARIDSKEAVTVAESTLNIEIEDLLTAEVPYEFSSEILPLVGIPDAYW